MSTIEGRSRVIFDLKNQPEGSQYSSPKSSVRLIYNFINILLFHI